MLICSFSAAEVSLLFTKAVTLDIDLPPNNLTDNRQTINTETQSLLASSVRLNKAFQTWT